MADFQTVAGSGLTLYALLFNASGNVWDVGTNAFVAYVGSSQSAYAIAMAEGAGNSPYYSGSMPSGVPAGYYVLVIYDQAGGSPASSDSTFGSGTITWSGSSTVSDVLNYASTAYIKQFMQINVSTYDVLITTLGAAATKAVDSYCRRPAGFWLTSYTDVLDGTDAYVLQLPHVPVTTLTQVTQNFLGSNPVVVAGSNYYVDAYTGQIQLLPTATGFSPYFYSGWGMKYQVTYSAGYVTIPADLQQACAMICQRLFQQASVQLLATQEQIGDYSATYTLAQTVIGADFGVKNLLDRYRDYTING